MKKLLIITLMSAVSMAASAQNALDKMFQKYAGDESFMEVNISSKMFSLITNMEVKTPEDKEVVEAISKIKGLRILRKENTSDARSLYKEAFSQLPTKEFEELMTVRDKDQDMKFYIREKSGKVSELIMIMGGAKDFMILSLFGEIDLKQISRIGRRMDVQGLEKLEKIDGGEKKN